MSADAAVTAQGSLPLEDWSQPPRRVPATSIAPLLAVDGFEGPLDWLLELARTRRIDLARLSIAALVEAFASALEAALAAAPKGPVVLARCGDWLVMAADLALLRSKLLVSADPVEAVNAAQAAERLRRGLLDRAAAGQLADWLDRHDQLGRDVFTRGTADEKDSPRAGRTGDLTGLLRACLAAIRLPDTADALFRVAGPPFWTVADAVERVRAVLAELSEAGAGLPRFLPAVPEAAPDRAMRCRVAVAATFLVGLELARAGDVTLEQDAAWAEVRIGPDSAKELGRMAPAA